MPDRAEQRREEQLEGTALIAQERLRQVMAEGWTPEHDDEHAFDQLAKAAACYALPVSVRSTEIWNKPLLDFLWPWDDEDWKPSRKDRIRELVKAGALIAAEIDRLQRAKEKASAK